MTIWACPVCQQPLVEVERGYRCEKNHSFDRAKEGYTNLLLANQKRKADPGDSKAMIASRRGFLSAGHYQPLAEKVVELLNSTFPENGVLLDSGCGEGYYLSQLIAKRSDIQVYGVDISRDAVKLASRALKQAQFAVASSFHLPVLDHSVDAVLRIFAPGDADEVKRVLKPEGTLAIVSPGPRHLFALKEKIYREPREHELPELPAGFTLVCDERVSFELTVEGRDAIQPLLAMTPFLWKGSREAKTELENAECFTTEVDFIIRLYQPT